MGERTAIEWTDHTFNPWIGCTRITPACDNCYAEALSARYDWAKWGDHPRKRTSESTWKQPRAWDRKALRDGVRRFVFCASLADVFDNQVEPQWRADLFALIRETPNLDWLLLTKRPQNIVKMVKAVGFMPPNIAFGTTVEDRARVKTNLPALTVAGGLLPRFLFVSAEPLLEDLGDLTPWLHPPGTQFCKMQFDEDYGHLMTPVRWIITGGESGPSPRPIEAEWARNLRDQCQAAGAAFFFKQWGGRTPKANGKSLDGREWCERPALSS